MEPDAPRIRHRINPRYTILENAQRWGRDDAAAGIPHAAAEAFARRLRDEQARVEYLNSFRTEDARQRDLELILQEAVKQLNERYDSPTEA